MTYFKRTEGFTLLGLQRIEQILEYVQVESVGKQYSEIKIKFLHWVQSINIPRYPYLMEFYKSRGY